MRGGSLPERRDKPSRYKAPREWHAKELKTAKKWLEMENQ